MFKTYGVIGIAALLVACGAPQPRQPLAPRTVAAPDAAPAETGVYRIDAGRSEVRVLVYRAGPMARLGHNHVIVNRAVGGWVKFLGDASAPSFAFSIPVAAFVVDDAQARADEGADFSDAVPQDAKAGTRRNMLSDALLDAERFPSLTLASTDIKQVSGQWRATLNVSIAGHPSTLVAPFLLEEASSSRIVASGTATLRQSALGLTPISVMLGALQVQDDITVKFRWVAVAG